MTARARPQRAERPEWLRVEPQSAHDRSRETPPSAADSSRLSLRVVDVPHVLPDSRGPRHAFTVDVEDWYQSCVDYEAPITERVVRNVDRILSILDERGVKGTFFVQGKVAEAFPEMVSALVKENHEVQAHGYSHRPLFAMSVRELREELTRAKQTVEDAAAMPVTAFRAQDFSIFLRNLWAFEILAETGFEIDSSIFPMRSRHYGIPNWRLGPHYVEADGFRILEVPVAISSYGRLRIPVAGGGYFRLLPFSLLRSGLRSIAAASRPAIVYCHPYEFNPDELASYPAVSRKLRFLQGIGRDAFATRIQTLLRTFEFSTMKEVLKTWGLP